MRNKIITIIILLVCQIFSIIFIINIYNQYKYIKKENTAYSSLLSQVSKSTPTTLSFHNLVYDISEIKVTYDLDEKLYDNITKVDILYHGKSFHKEYLGALYTAYLLDEIMFGQPMLVVIRGEGQSINTNMIAFDGNDKSVHEISFINKEKDPPNELCCNYILFIPKKDGIHYDIGMPNFSSNLQPIQEIPQITKYSYDKEKYSFVESD